MDGKFATRPLSSLKRQPIRHDQGGDDELKALAQSWLTRAIHPIIVRPDFTIADGNRRVAGLELLGMTEAEVFVTTENLTDDQMVEVAFISAVHRKGLTDYERMQAIQCLATAHPDWSQKRLGDHVYIDGSVITKLLSLSDCLPEVVEAARAGKLSVGDWYLMSGKPREKQIKLLKMKIKGATRDQLAKDAAKDDQQEADPPEKVARLKCPLPSGRVVTVAGEELSLEDAMDAMIEAAKLVKVALAKGLNAKTAMNVWKDVAAAAG